jgi:signal transduction histidine kinase
MLLFLGAIVAPCAVLLWLGVRTVRQDEELAATRAVQDRRNAVSVAKRELQAHLESIEVRASNGLITPLDPDVALIARVQADQLIFPWEETPWDSNATRALEDLQAASKMFREGNSTAVHTIAARLLNLPAGVRDEYGIPFTVYAMRLLAGTAPPGELNERIVRILDQYWLPPAALYMIAELPGVREEIRNRSRDRAAELENADRPSAEIAQFEHSDVLWFTLADGPWLARIKGGRLIAVRARRVLDAIPLPGRSHWILGKDTTSEPLGADFPNLSVAQEQTAMAAPASRSRFYVAAAVLLSIAAFSAWLLYRDIGREARLARLHAQFVSSVSHELRTPIASIRAYAEFIDMGRARNAAEASEYVKTIIGESERLTRLVESVLDFSKVEQGKRLYRFGSVSLEQVVRSAAKAVDYPLAQGAFRLSMDIGSGLPAVKADQEALEQAVANLLNNAIKYSGDSREINLSLQHIESMAVIAVRDEGIGIALEEQSRIFESFYRAPPTDGRHVSGAGLGLTLVDHIVKAHKGRVEVKSRPGRGSTFSIFLPIEADE